MCQILHGQAGRRGRERQPRPPRGTPTWGTRGVVGEAGLNAQILARQPWGSSRAGAGLRLHEDLPARQPDAVHTRGVRAPLGTGRLSPTDRGGFVEMPPVSPRGERGPADRVGPGQRRRHPLLVLARHRQVVQGGSWRFRYGLESTR